MQLETRTRSVLKAVSWRTLATLTTALIVFLFTGRVALALTVGVLEVFAKMALYFFHERLWQKIRFGRRDVPSFVVWFTGLPASGKKEVADRLYRRLAGTGIKVERLDSHDVRHLFPKLGFTPEEVDRHVKRAGHLCSMLEKNGVSVVASFVSPYREGRRFARSLATNFVEVYMKSTVEACERRDRKGHYARARRGEYRFFPGVDVTYEEPESAEIVIEIDHMTADEAADRIYGYLRRKYLNGI